MDGRRLEVPPETLPFWRGVMLRCFGDRGARPAAAELLKEIEAEQAEEAEERAREVALGGGSGGSARRSSSSRTAGLETPPPAVAAAPPPAAAAGGGESGGLPTVGQAAVGDYARPAKPVAAAAAPLDVSEPAAESTAEPAAESIGLAKAAQAIAAASSAEQAVVLRPGAELPEPEPELEAQDEEEEEEDPQPTDDDAERIRNGGTPLVRRVSRRLSADSMRLWAGVRSAHILSGRTPIGADEARWTAAGQPSRPRRASEEGGIFDAIARRCAAATRQPSLATQQWPSIARPALGPAAAQHTLASWVVRFLALS